MSVEAMDTEDFNPEQPLPDLHASFSMKRSLLRRERIVAGVYALSDKGCVIKTDENFESGDTIRLALSLNMPFESPATPLLSGRVINSTKYCSNFFYTIEFSDNPRPTTCSAIARIREILERKVALTDRRRGGRRPARRTDLRIARA